MGSLQAGWAPWLKARALVNRSLCTMFSLLFNNHILLLPFSLMWVWSQRCKLENCPISAVSLRSEQLNHVICFLLRPWLIHLILYSTNKKRSHLLTSSVITWSTYTYFSTVLPRLLGKMQQVHASFLSHGHSNNHVFPASSYQESSKNQMDVKVLRRAEYFVHAWSIVSITVATTEIGQPKF